MKKHRVSVPDLFWIDNVEKRKMNSAKCRLSVISAVIRTAVVTSIAIFSGATHAVENRAFDRNAMAVIEKAHRILVSNGYCANSNDCRKKKIIFVGPSSDGFDVYVYGVNDQSVVNQIVIACLEERLVAKFNFSVRFYSVSKDQELSRPIWNKPSYSEFTFKWESK